MTDLRRWPEWTHAYQDIRWIDGEQWAPGSRREVQLGPPFAMVMQTTVIAYEPFARIGWIDHAVGITVERWFEFHALPDGTRLDYWLDFTGVREADEAAVQGLIHSVLSPWIEAYRQRCEQLFAAPPSKIATSAS